eukprot:TRINITY_DN8546_c0_g2_i2.p2 TRINITY_DN8546_c0_g2~~TRINITY_DN8546_c0_g2_i2.p2  ORF type:complete len:124 (-),score=25.02 TRINITY_DN8546_c0_g2_i2:68-439(-)
MCIRDSYIGNLGTAIGLISYDQLLSPSPNYDNQSCLSMQRTCSDGDCLNLSINKENLSDKEGETCQGEEVYHSRRSYSVDYKPEPLKCIDLIEKLTEELQQRKKSLEKIPETQEEGEQEKLNG